LTDFGHRLPWSSVGSARSPARSPGLRPNESGLARRRPFPETPFMRSSIPRCSLDNTQARVAIAEAPTTLEERDGRTWTVRHLPRLVVTDNSLAPWRSRKGGLGTPAMVKLQLHGLPGGLAPQGSALTPASEAPASARAAGACSCACSVVRPEASASEAPVIHLDHGRSVAAHHSVCPAVFLIHLDHGHGQPWPVPRRARQHLPLGHPVRDQLSHGLPARSPRPPGPRDEGEVQQATNGRLVVWHEHVSGKVEGRRPCTQSVSAGDRDAEAR
jgi:hypothetical protein